MATRNCARAWVLLFLAALGCGASETPGPSAGSGGTAGTAGSGASVGSGGTAGGGAGGTDGSGGTGVSGGSGGQSAADAATDGDVAPDAAPITDGAPADAADARPLGPAKIVLVAGGTMDKDGVLALEAKLGAPFGAVVDPINGDIYIAEYSGNHVRRIDDKGLISTVVGAGAPGSGGQFTLNKPHDLLFQPGTRILFIADTFGDRVLRMDASTGQVVAFAGKGTQLAPGITQAYGVEFDHAGEHIYMTDTGSGKIHVVDLKTNAITSISTPNPRAIAVDSKKNLYVVAVNGSVLKKIDPAGKTTDVVGMLNAPKRLTVDAEDNIVICDTEKHNILQFTWSTMKITRLVGNDMPGTGTLGGPPEMAQLDRPHGVFFDGQQRLYIADSFNNRVLRIER